MQGSRRQRGDAAYAPRLSCFPFFFLSLFILFVSPSFFFPFFLALALSKRVAHCKKKKKHRSKRGSLNRERARSFARPRLFPPPPLLPSPPPTDRAAPISAPSTPHARIGEQMPSLSLH